MPVPYGKVRLFRNEINTMQWRSVMQFKYTSIISELRHLVELVVSLTSPAALFPAKKPSISIECEAWWIPVSVCILWWTEKYLLGLWSIKQRFLSSILLTSRISWNLRSIKYAWRIIRLSNIIHMLKAYLTFLLHCHSLLIWKYVHKLFIFWKILIEFLQQIL